MKLKPATVAFSLFLVALVGVVGIASAMGRASHAQPVASPVTAYQAPVMAALHLDGACVPGGCFARQESVALPAPNEAAKTAPPPPWGWNKIIRYPPEAVQAFLASGCIVQTEQPAAFDEDLPDCPPEEGGPQ